ncbi:ATP-binding cassette domain-containing protein [Amycolatopsis sp. NPDC059657]|uniref:ATP-binding cassette domain-containing protein n=1 Tax=Amycolatopsis sp. NPDC059657 TaxID=3346899 RepID=UPI00366EE89E
MNSPDFAIVMSGLRKRYKRNVALAGLDLAIATGTVCGLLGPNGAGKTTAVRILATLLRPDGGTARVAGHDVVREPAQVRRRIGWSGQFAAVDDVLTGRDNLVMFARLNRLDAKAARRRADELLEQFGLTAVAGVSLKRYSGGMRRRIDLAASLIIEPGVLFLDEPTTGLDPRSRQEMWSAIRALADRGGTVLLTTQYLHEADQMAGQIAVMDQGAVIAEGTPDELKSKIGNDLIELVLRDERTMPEAMRLMADATGKQPSYRLETRTISVPVADRVQALADVAGALERAAIDVEDLGLRRPSLDEVFVRLTERRPEGSTR